MYKTVEKILLEFDPESKNILPALNKLSANFGYINEVEAQKVANYFSVNLAKIYETASFYDLLKIKKEASLEVKICSGGNCTVDNSFKVIKAVERFLGVRAGDDFNPKKKIEIVSCLGRCGEGPIMIVNNKVFEKVRPEKVSEILEKIYLMEDIKIITANWGKINSQKIEDYFHAGGYQALQKYLKEINPFDHLKEIEEIKKSGLVGRGGAGFLTGQKIEAVFNEKSEEKYFICNLDESEPGTFKDRLIAENDPHLLLEGIIILSLIIKAKKAFIYLNGNFSKAKEILEKAIEDAKEKNFLGENILGSKNSLEIEVFSGAGAYICGEETALISSLEGNRGEPRYKPPYPTQSGFLGKPTLINNAETVCNIPWIISNGGKAYSQIGSPCSPGTKLYSIGGAVKKSGLYEAPTGITIAEAIDLAGGVDSGKDFWFAQIGGASGKLVLEKDLGEKLEYSKDCKIPCGSGAILVVDRSVDIHELLLSWTGFFRRESCGKCVPCREGTFRLHEIAKRLQDGEISERDEKAIEDILFILDNTTYCPLGKFAAVAFRDAMENFRTNI